MKYKRPQATDCLDVERDLVQQHEYKAACIERYGWLTLQAKGCILILFCVIILAIFIYG